MFTWLMQNCGTLLVGAILLLIVGAVVRSMRVSRKKSVASGGCTGNCSCCGGCTAGNSSRR